MWVKIVECPDEALPFVQYGPPAQAGLHELQRQQFEQRSAVMKRRSPFKVVILAHLHVFRIAPRAAM
jgi:hypothetical protein